ncbi:S100 calcium binding protein U [Fundulus heteroclitus]|uniref:Protein S100-A16 n=1 Tax=Fundulus heteroclitus TaxID=8078 RepID=A0A146ZUF7_FUNHE|nr:S100 calcium binding protein U [Fundulus heteroclitus]
MEDAIQVVVKTFLKSTKGKENLGKKQFQSLVSSQLSNILTDTDSKQAIDNMGQQLDSDNDGKLGFEEYLKLIGYLACSYSEQRSREKEEPAKNAASEQVAQSPPDKSAEQPKENEEPKEEANPKENEEAKANATAEVKAEAEAPGETKPEAAKVEAAAPAEAEVKAAEKEPEKVEETPKVEDPTEKSPAAAEEEGAEKTEEASS